MPFTPNSQRRNSDCRFNLIQSSLHIYFILFQKYFIKLTTSKPKKMEEHQHQEPHQVHHHHHPEDDGAILVDAVGTTMDATTAPKSGIEDPVGSAAGFPPLEEPGEENLPPDTECMCDKEEETQPAVSAPTTSNANGGGEMAKTTPPGGPAAAVAPAAPGNGSSNAAAAAAVIAKVPAHVAAEAVAKKKRLCRYPGCVKVIKSQGHCQRHGAKAKRCKVEDCEKQAQGTHDGTSDTEVKGMVFALVGVFLFALSHSSLFFVALSLALP